MKPKFTKSEGAPVGHPKAGEKGNEGTEARRGDPELGRANFLPETAFRLWAIGVVGVSLVFVFQSAYPDFIGPLSNVLPSLGAGAAFLSAFLYWKRYGFGYRRRFDVVWLSFTVGTGLWVLAELTWATYYFVLNIPVPYPSIADVFYVGGYFPMIAGLALYLSTFSVAMSKKRLGIALLSVVAATTLALEVVVPAELGEGLPPINVITDLSYPILDLALFSLTILCLAIFLGGTISKWWVLFGVASLLYVIGNEYFLYQIAAGTYYNGSLDDLVFILGYLTFSLAFFVHRREF